MHSIPRTKLTPAESRLREFALSFPEATEDFPWGHRAFKVNKKIFATLVTEKEYVTVSLKLPKSGKAALKEAFCEPTHYGMGKHGWVTARFDVGDELPVARLEEWMEESYRAVAPKRLAGAERVTAKSPVRKKAPAGARGRSSVSFEELQGR
jgi:predicted DNA-binding protein (MmcQ/YjbR family)